VRHECAALLPSGAFIYESREGSATRPFARAGFSFGRMNTARTGRPYLCFHFARSTIVRTSALESTLSMILKQAKISRVVSCLISSSFKQSSRLWNARSSADSFGWFLARCMTISLVSDDAPAEKCVPCYLERTFDYAIGKSCGTVGLMLLDLVASDLLHDGPDRQAQRLTLSRSLVERTGRSRRMTISQPFP
jgi:hypothetical protein